MRVFKRVKDIRFFLAQKRNAKTKIGFVPTMGALHEGHISLVLKSKTNTAITVCSIFVNPTQFNDKKDLEKYPRTVEKDIEALVKAGCDVLFLPSVEEIYPPQHSREAGIESSSPTEFGNNLFSALDTVFEGASRPGHFNGVRQVVERLFRIVEPDEVFFGQKDYQQCMVVENLIALTPFFENIKIDIVPTLREANGLAMSSRNMRLSPQQREAASAIYKSLLFLKENIKPGSTEAVLKASEKKLKGAGLNPDYIAIANANTLQQINTWDGITPIVALIAAFMGEVRLIDNLILYP